MVEARRIGLQDAGHVTTGILDPARGLRRFSLTRYPAGPEFRSLVDGYWTVDWDLPERESYTQEILAYPSVDLVFEPGSSFVWGVCSGVFARSLQGSGWAFGAKFRPGGFYPFLRSDVSAITDATLPVEAVFGPRALALERDLGSVSPDERAALLDGFFAAVFPEPDERVGLVGRIIDRIRSDPDVKKVEDLVPIFNTGERQLQRLFRTYVGVGPKWVILRSHLQKAAELIARDPVAGWTEFALDLGYYDQSHFIRAFKAAVGKTPKQYSESQRQP